MADSAEVRSLAGDSQRRCTYCFQELNEMTDPRQLPCNHIVCLTCVENDWKIDELQCRACNKDIKVESIAKLPKLAIALAIDIVRSDNRPSETLVKSEQCDICDLPSPAVIFCIDCGKKSCTAHKESHQHYYKETHTTINISTFSASQKYYANVCCQKHPEKFLQFIRSRCNDMRCPLCLSTQGACIISGSHQYLPLDNMRVDVEKEFQQDLKRISEKIKEICNLEKKTWQTVDKMTDNYNQLREKVDEFTSKQILAIQKKSAELKAEISGYQETEMVKAQGYIQSLLDKVDSLESTHAFVSSFLRSNHITSVVKEKPRLKSQLRTKIQIDTSSEFTCQECGVVTEGLTGSVMQLEPNTEILFEPGSPQRQQEATVSNIVSERRLTLAGGKKSRSLAYNELGQLVFGSSSFILLSNCDDVYSLREPTDIAFTPHAVCSVAQYRMCIYAALSNGKVVQILPFQESPEMIELFQMKNSTIHCKLCVSGEFLVVSQSNQNLLLHNLLTGIRKNIIPPGVSVVTSLCFDHDGHLLVLDSKEGKVNKFKITENMTLQLLWSCGGIPNGLALCIDTTANRRCIFVNGLNKTIYMIQAGQIIKVLTCDDLPIHVPGKQESCSIAVCGDTLVSNGHQSPEFYTFQLVH